MKLHPQIKIGSRVKRMSSDYTNGRTGTIAEIKGDRARVAWDGNPRTWVNFRFLSPMGSDVEKGPWIETPRMNSYSAFRICVKHSTGERWHEYQGKKKFSR